MQSHFREYYGLSIPAKQHCTGVILIRRRFTISSTQNVACNACSLGGTIDSFTLSIAGRLCAQPPVKGPFVVSEECTNKISL